MNRSIVNRWGYTLTVGDNVRAVHARGGNWIARIVKFDTRSAYAKAYGTTVMLDTGGSVSIDDCKPVTHEAQT